MKGMPYKPAAVWLLCLVVLSACNTGKVTVRKKHLYIQAAGRENKSWQLVWEDNFNSPALDTSKWTLIPPNNADWGRHMTNDPRCYKLDSGKLYLRGMINPDTSKDHRPFLTAGIYSKGKFAFQYGMVEIRARLESARGAWPAIWMLAETDKYGAYPKNGEIDIMEHLNYDSIIYQTTHSWYTLELKQTNNPPHSGTAHFNPGEYNIFGIRWYPDKIVFCLNGKETFTYPYVPGADITQWPYDQPFYLLIDQQLGGSWVGKVQPETLPVQMIIDWVKVYQ
ncbi:glycoside hydrolase family 16 protein [Chitinophaga sp. Mgbs1]|uniref:Glycoside hydrolase family 16 protein n=1 Tax=Chitinophaga solisilvae TaxID=1233460 RepID=A0A433WF29_9BACT|nr:glycoside hydrolase family 16 protein [Chitinophaga solisilvae]